MDGRLWHVVKDEEYFTLIGSWLVVVYRLKIKFGDRRISIFANTCRIQRSE